MAASCGIVRKYCEDRREEILPRTKQYQGSTVVMVKIASVKHGIAWYKYVILKAGNLSWTKQYQGSTVAMVTSSQVLKKRWETTTHFIKVGTSGVRTIFFFWVTTSSNLANMTDPSVMSLSVVQFLKHTQLTEWWMREHRPLLRKIQIFVWYDQRQGGGWSCFNCPDFPLWF